VLLWWSNKSCRTLCERLAWEWRDKGSQRKTLQAMYRHAIADVVKIIRRMSASRLIMKRVRASRSTPVIQRSGIRQPCAALGPQLTLASSHWQVIISKSDVSDTGWPANHWGCCGPKLGCAGLSNISFSNDTCYSPEPGFLICRYTLVLSCGKWYRVYRPTVSIALNQASIYTVMSDFQ